MSEVDTNSDEFKQAVADAAEALFEEKAAGLKAKNAELIAKNNKLRANNQIDPAELAAVEAERDDLKAKLTEANKAASKAAKELEAANKRADETTAAHHASMRDSALTDALTKAGVAPAFLDAVKAMHEKGVQVVEGKVMAGDKAVGDFIKEWAGSDAGKHFVAAPDTTGGGSQGGRGSNETGNKLPDPTDKAGRAAVFAQRLAAASHEE